MQIILKIIRKGWKERYEIGIYKENEYMLKNEKNIILFGAGKFGLEAMERYGKERIAYFCDNNVDKHGKFIEGIEVISSDRMYQLYKENYYIVITPKENIALCEQLKKHGIYDYLEYINSEGLQSRNPYEMTHERKRKYAENDGKLEMCVEAYRKQDLLEDISLYKNVIKNLLKDNKDYLNINGKQGESNFYGNLEALLEYAHIDSKDACIFPSVSHLSTFSLVGGKYNTAVIFQGEYGKKIMHEFDPCIPVFTIGPFIHYATGIYSEEKCLKLKKKNGRTLTIFAVHGTEIGQLNIAYKEWVEHILECYGKEFDTIWACIYWSDINSPLCEYFEKKGIHVVSAGCRFDNQFDRRVKTILELSDAIICGEMGSHVNYALYMNKPVGYIPCEKRDVLKSNPLALVVTPFEGYQMYKEQFDMLFNEELRITLEQKSFCNLFGGFDQIRDERYIQNIMQISKDIWKLCDYKEGRYRIGVYLAYESYLRSGDVEKAHMLKQAVGKGML